MELLETFFQLFHIGLVGIIRDGYRLCLQVCVEVLQSLLKRMLLFIFLTQFSHFICATLNTAVRMSFAIAADAQKSTTAKVIKNLLVFIVLLLI